MENITIRLVTVDGYRQTRTFKTLKGAQTYARRQMGDVEITGRHGYAVDAYGNGRMTATGVDLFTLFGQDNWSAETPAPAPTTETPMQPETAPAATCEHGQREDAGCTACELDAQASARLDPWGFGWDVSAELDTPVETPAPAGTYTVWLARDTLDTITAVARQDAQDTVWSTLARAAQDTLPALETARCEGGAWAVCVTPLQARYIRSTAATGAVSLPADVVAALRIGQHAALETAALARSAVAVTLTPDTRNTALEVMACQPVGDTAAVSVLRVLAVARPVNGECTVYLLPAALDTLTAALQARYRAGDDAAGPVLALLPGPTR